MKKLIAVAIVTVSSAVAIPAKTLPQSHGIALGPIDPFPPDPCKDKRGKTPDCPVEHPIVSAI